MPPKLAITRQEVIESTFNLLRKEGTKSLSARNIGKKLGMSTMIIYSNFQNMEELIDILLEKSWKLLGEFQRKNFSPYKILNLGFGYIQFAQKEKILFKWMFQEENVTQKYWEYLLRDLFTEIYPELKRNVGKNSTKEKLREIFEELWIYVHGFATLLNSGALSHTKSQEIQEKLMGIFKSLTSRG